MSRSDSVAAIVKRLLVVAAALVACKQEPTPEPKPAPTPIAPPKVAGRPAQLRQIKLEAVPSALAVIVPADQDLAALEKAAREQAKATNLTLDVTRSTARDLEIDREHAQWMLGNVPASDFDVIDRANALLLDIKQPTGYAGIRALSSVAAALATKANGWVLDPGIGGLFRADTFTKRAHGDKPDTRKLIAIHAISGDGEQPYLDTMGMNRLGLPELYVPAAAPGQIDPLMVLVNATAQTLVQRGDISRAGELDVDLAQLDGEWDLEAIKQAGGKGRITWRLEWSGGGHDDADGAQLHLALLPMKGTGTEGVAMTLDTFFGDVPDPVTDIEANDPELLAAGKRARDELTKMRPRFAKGVPVGEQLIVKAPFRSKSDHVEWMWVDVIKWRGGDLTGNLDNDPVHVENLKLGSKVTVKVDDVADYMHVAKDGTQSGGHSVEVMRKRGLIK